MSDKLRLQFDFSPEAAKDLEKLKNDMGLTSRVNVVKQALGLLQWIVEKRKGGAVLLIEEKGKQLEVVFPTLAPLGRKSATKPGSP